MIETLVVLLLGVVISVPLTRRAGFGSVLGYLVAGVVIGPSVLGLVQDVQQISDVAEFGVLMLLFLIGLELRPQRVWLMRRAVFGLGLGQMLLAGGAIAGLAHLAGLAWVPAAVVGAGLALSSTAIVLPMLGERNLLGTPAGRDSFAVLLFQDLASVPLVALVPLLAAGGVAAVAEPGWARVLRTVSVIVALVVGGRYLLRPIFRVVSGTKAQEVFTATALLLVAGASAIAEYGGLPMSMGAFAAGVLLSESEYRHELEADVKPFEGLLLGFFFISVGMSANIRLALSVPLTIGLGVVAMLAIKIAVSYLLARVRRMKPVSALRFALALPQGSEFGFVLFGAALEVGALPKSVSDEATLVIALSMMASPVLFSLAERYLVPRLMPVVARPFDDVSAVKPAAVILFGFGRVGQIVGRILTVRGVGFIALDADVATIDLVRKFGGKAFYGDPTRLDMLESVHAGEAKVLVVALGDMNESLAVVQNAQRHYPHLVIVARARNRQHVYKLMDLGVRHIVRETFFSSLRLGEVALVSTGLSPAEARRAVHLFREHDERTLVDQHEIYEDEAQLVQSAAQVAAELREIMAADMRK
jgi:CPA2 family monovalent cation:H+ antiporter-2/glutathione-regulated potassium-efflux system protein KefB